MTIRLMELLGYERYVAQGGDWGAAISTAMAVKRPERVLALHLNMILGFPPDPADPLKGLNDKERAAQAYRTESQRAQAATTTLQEEAAQPLNNQLQVARERLEALDAVRIDRVEVSDNALTRIAY